MSRGGGDFGHGSSTGVAKRHGRVVELGRQTRGDQRVAKFDRKWRLRGRDHGDFRIVDLEPAGRLIARDDAPVNLDDGLRIELGEGCACRCV